LQFASSKAGHPPMFCRRLFPGQTFSFTSANINHQQPAGGAGHGFIW
jgi:hypothetical protein